MSWEYRDLAGDPQEAHRLGEDLNTCRNNSRLTFYSVCGTKAQGSSGKGKLPAASGPLELPLGGCSWVLRNPWRRGEQTGQRATAGRTPTTEVLGVLWTPRHSLTRPRASVGLVTMPTSLMKTWGTQEFGWIASGKPRGTGHSRGDTYIRARVLSAAPTNSHTIFPFLVLRGKGQAQSLCDKA